MVGVDVGGTFTDVVSFEDGQIRAVKVPTNPSKTELSVLEGARAVGVSGKATFNHASTIGLNAVITRNLPKVAFLTTLGHRDILDIGRVWRPPEALTNPHWRRSFGDATAPLVPRYLRRGIKERIQSNGKVLIPLDDDQAREELVVLKRCGVKGIAICLINAYVNAEHELRLRSLVAEALGDIPCSISSEVSPLAKEFARASTTVVDALMKIVFKQYTGDLVAGLTNAGFRGKVNFADCAAMLVTSDFAMDRPFRIVFSGPAAGTVSSGYFGQVIGEPNLLCCDIGGTSCDISIVTGGKPVVNTAFELEHDLIVNTLANEISTLGAGGGSIISISRSGELKVGPESAGAEPGPACYGKGGTVPTMSDACLMIGILSSEHLLGGTLKLDRDLAQAAFERLETNLDLEQRVGYAYKMGLNNISEGLLDITIKHGVDPRDYSLIAYGSAGPMLLPPILDQIGARSVVVPPYPGLFSALGLLSSDLVYSDSRSAYVFLFPDAAATVNRVFETIEESLLSTLSARREDVTIRRTFDGHLVGQTWETPFVDVPAGTIDADAVGTMVANFHAAYQKRWCNRFDALPVVGATYRVQVIVPMEKVAYQRLPTRNGLPLHPEGRTQLRFLGDGPVEAAEYDRGKLLCGDVIVGPAIIRETTSTIQVCADQVATVGHFGEITIRRT